MIYRNSITQSKIENKKEKEMKFFSINLKRRTPLECKESEIEQGREDSREKVRKKDSMRENE
jgi:hypothetical protein